MKLKPEAAAVEPIPGVPWRDMPDDEFAAVSAAYEAQFSPDQAGCLAKWFERVDDAKATKKSAAPAAEGK